MPGKIAILPGSPGRGTSRRLVEGYPFTHAFNNQGYNRTDICKHLARRNTQRLDSAFAQERIAPHIALGPVPAVVGLSVDFDGQTRRGTEEIEDIVAGRVLAAELEAAGALLEHGPERRFRRRHCAPHRFGARDGGVGPGGKLIADPRMLPVLPG